MCNKELNSCTVGVYNTSVSVESKKVHCLLKISLIQFNTLFINSSQHKLLVIKA